jgi:hypothetical protein
MLKLYTYTTVLVDLRFKIYWDSGRFGHEFPPVAFAAEVVTESIELFLHSLDLSCLDRIRATTRYTMYSFAEPINYEVERSFVWKGLAGGSKLSIRGLSQVEFENQLALMKKRRWRDSIRVEMAVEIKAGTELRNRTCAEVTHQLDTKSWESE